MSTTRPKPEAAGTMTYEEFLNWTDEEDVLLDVIGKPYADYLRQRMQRRGV